MELYLHCLEIMDRLAKIQNDWNSFDDQRKAMFKNDIAVFREWMDEQEKKAPPGNLTHKTLTVIYAKFLP